MPRVYTDEQKSRNLEAQRKRRAKNPDRVREIGRKSEQRRRLKRYGLTYDEYKNMLLSQNDLCAICGNFKSHSREWHVDHCHETGLVRGILCHHCNLLLGNSKDSIDILKKAIKYLEKSKLNT